MAQQRLLVIIETAYRATLQEQDDPALWLSHSLRNAGADVDILLRGNAVNYAVKGQDASGLAFGEARQTQPPRLAEDLAGLSGKGARVLYLEEDARIRGLRGDELIESVRPVPARALSALLEEYGQIWAW